MNKKGSTAGATPHGDLARSFGQRCIEVVNFAMEHNATHFRRQSLLIRLPFRPMPFDVVHIGIIPGNQPLHLLPHHLLP